VVERYALIQDRPVEPDCPSAAEGRLIRGIGIVLIEVGRPGFGIERHVFEPEAAIIALFDELIAWTGGLGGSQFEVLKGIFLEVGGREPEQAFGDKKSPS
jgi:hypothetical protein